MRVLIGRAENSQMDAVQLYFVGPFGSSSTFRHSIQLSVEELLYCLSLLVNSLELLDMLRFASIHRVTKSRIHAVSDTIKGKAFI